MPRLTDTEANTYLQQEPVILNRYASDLTNNISGKLTILKPIYIIKGHIYWLCKCDCGKYCAVTSSRLKHKRTLSCGCYWYHKTKNPQKLKVGINDLATTHPDIVKEWDYQKNQLSPKDYTSGSKYKAWWICSNNHSYDATILHRTQENNNCPYCSNQKPIIGETDLLTTHSKLCEEWNYIKNKYGPDQYVAGSGKNVWWICRKCGYTWKSAIRLRTQRKSGCPKCNFSKGENKIVEFLDKNNIKYKPQKTFQDCKHKSKLRFDFYIPNHNLCIEYNGIQHYKTWSYDNYSVEGLKLRRKRDKIKKQYCKQNNINFLPIKYTQFNEIETLIKKKLKSINKQYE